jgi:hypothetical protein
LAKLSNTDYDTTWVAPNLGSVTSVTGTSPVASSGGATPDISLASGYGDTQNPYASKTANFVLAAPNGTSGVPTFRAVVAADIPTLNQNTTGTAANVTGIVAVANGGSGTATPSLVAGSNVTITGSWPNQTIAASSGGGGSALTISNKTGAYTVVAGDLGTIINCTSGTFTVSLTAAATLGAGFNCWIWNTGTGAITIDPNGTETVDGVDPTTEFKIGQGTGVQLVCTGTAWLTGDTRNSGAASIGVLGVQIGRNSAGNMAIATSGQGAMALGGSRASGTDSFAAAVADNTASHGATGTNSISVGPFSLASGFQSVAIGSSATATNTVCLALGKSATATASGSVAIGAGGTGFGTTSSARNSIALGDGALSNIVGKFTYASGSSNIALGTYQFGTLVLSISTTNATSATLNSYNFGTTDATNQVILPNNSAYAFTGIIVARRQASGGTESAAWKVEGLIRREANAASTTLVASTVTAIDNTPGWTLALSADTTNGGLKVEATGAAATNIRWVATIQTSEVTYA